MRRSGWIAGILVVASLLGAPAGARDERGELAGPVSGDPDHLLRAHAVATRALRWLADRIQSDGSVQLTRAEAQPKLAAAALTALAFMANGHTADESEDGYGARVRAVIGWLMTQAAISDCTCPSVSSHGPHEFARFVDPAFTTSDMHTQGYVAWALAMAYGMSFGSENVDQRVKLARVTQAAIHQIELAQHASGGWWYHYDPGDGHEGSVTITVLQALRSAKEAGLRVDAAVIEKAIRYLRQSQVDTEGDPAFGGFRYRVGDKLTSFALTAAAVSSLNQTGDYDSKFVDYGIEYMRQKDPLTNPQMAFDERWRWYGRFYATQAYWQYRELRHFRGWYPQLVRVAESEQDARDGRFSDSEFSDVYATAMAALTLGVPFGYLPSFQR